MADLSKPASRRGRPRSRSAEALGDSPSDQETPSMTADDGEQFASEDAPEATSDEEQARDPRYLADSLAGLLASVDVEVAAVSDLAHRIDKAADELMSLFGEQRDRMAVLQQLRDSVHPGSLANFLHETIQPDLPQRLGELREDIDVTRTAIES